MATHTVRFDQLPPLSVILSGPAKGQTEAAYSLGLSKRQVMASILVPQAVRAMLPALISQCVVVLKDTSLGYIVGYSEIIRNNMNGLGSFYGNRYAFSLFVVTLLIYLAINLTLSSGEDISLLFARPCAQRTRACCSSRRLSTLC